MAYGKRIKELREENNITQNKLASILEVSRSSITKYESEEREPGFAILLKMSHLFGVSIDYLLGKTNISEVNTSKLNSEEEKISSLDAESFINGSNLTCNQKKAINGLIYDYLQLINTENPMSIDFIFLTNLMSDAIQSYYYTVYTILFDVDNNGNEVRNEITDKKIIALENARAEFNKSFNNCYNILFKWLISSQSVDNEIYNLDNIVEKYYNSNRGIDYMSIKKKIYEILK